MLQLDAVTPAGGMLAAVYVRSKPSTTNRKQVVFDGVSLQFMKDMANPVSGLTLAYIGVEERLRKQGRAKRVMRQICDLADLYHVTLNLSVAPGKTGMTAEQLIDWYAWYGFATEGVNPQAWGTLMLRKPR